VPADRRHGHVRRGAFKGSLDMTNHPAGGEVATLYKATARQVELDLHLPRTSPTQSIGEALGLEVDKPAGFLLESMDEPARVLHPGDAREAPTSIPGRYPDAPGFNPVPRRATTISSAPSIARQDHSRMYAQVQRRDRRRNSPGSRADTLAREPDAPSRRRPRVASKILRRRSARAGHHRPNGFRRASRPELEGALREGRRRLRSPAGSSAK
jgi:hypothetical protein